MGMSKLIAVDPSLSCSGWALFEIENGRLLGVGTVKTLDARHALADRMAKLQKNIAKVFAKVTLHEGDVVICEDATSMKDPSAAAKLEQVRGIFETLARDAGAQVPGRIHPRTIQYELLGMRGKQHSREVVKFAAVQTVMQLFAEDLSRLHFDVSSESLERSQDIVDALLLGSLALGRIACAQNAGMSLAEYFDSLTQPNRGRRGISV